MSLGRIASYVIALAVLCSNGCGDGESSTSRELGAMGTFQKWSMVNHCTGSPTMTGSGCQTYSQCDAGVEVTLCTTTGGSHSTGDPDIGWAMLEKHPMP